MTDIERAAQEVEVALQTTWVISYNYLRGLHPSWCDGDPISIGTVHTDCGYEAITNTLASLGEHPDLGSAKTALIRHFVANRGDVWTR